MLVPYRSFYWIPSLDEAMHMHKLFFHVSFHMPAFGACKSFGFTRGFLPLGSEVSFLILFWLAIFIDMKKVLYSLYDPVCDLLLSKKVLRMKKTCKKREKLENLFVFAFWVDGQPGVSWGYSWLSKDELVCLCILEKGKCLCLVCFWVVYKCCYFCYSEYNKLVGLQLHAQRRKQAFNDPRGKPQTSCALTLNQIIFCLQAIWS